ncbi:MAG TPA: ribosome maturation factor RimM [Gammaproteobacteria bacterium]|nr:ribosome maturation factor RimM [Gammaproteobacteria bacterium]
MSAESDRVIRLGEVTGAHGIKGWIKVRSYTEPRTNLLDYPSWLLDPDGEWRPFVVESAREAGRRLLAKLAGIDDRDSAAALGGLSVGVPRSAMPGPGPGEYYWADLEGLTVRNLEGERLGTVERLMATGANDVLVLAGGGERMIPFIEGDTVREVDLDSGEILVDWDPSYWE